MPSTTLSTVKHRDLFHGFEPLTANYIYCPNQLFDVCLPNYSRGVVRLVGYILYKTLSHLDENGNPIEQDFHVTYEQLIDEAGISRGAITNATNEAMAGKFIDQPASGTYALRWSDGAYETSLKSFNGFYTGDGNRSPIPNAFFTQVIRYKRLSVAKVVGTVLRHTVGYQNQFGGRRSQHPLSYSYLQKVANIRHRPTLADAIHDAIKDAYICIAEQGRFDPHGGKNNRPTSYSVKWLQKAESKASSSKTEPATKQYKNRTGMSTKFAPVKEYKNRTHRKTEQKEIQQQQRERSGNSLPVAADFSKSIQLLREEGFDDKAARGLAKAGSSEEIQQQIAWIDLRKPENRLGMLRTAIEQKWVEPVGVQESKAKQRRTEREHEQDAMRAADDAAIADEVRKRNERRKALLVRWRDRQAHAREQYHHDAIAESLSTFDRIQLRRHTNLDDPPMATLLVMARVLGIAKVS